MMTIGLKERNVNISERGPLTRVVANRFFLVIFLKCNFNMNPSFHLFARLVGRSVIISLKDRKVKLSTFLSEHLFMS